eukprot:3300284-Pyramimonas_sp.AAC.1
MDDGAEPFVNNYGKKGNRSSQGRLSLFLFSKGEPTLCNVCGAVCIVQAIRSKKWCAMYFLFCSNPRGTRNVVQSIWTSLRCVTCVAQSKRNNIGGAAHMAQLM